MRGDFKKMLKGKVLKDFNDGEDNLKNYVEGSTYQGEEKRYNELRAKGFVESGKEVETEVKKKTTKKTETKTETNKDEQVVEGAKEEIVDDKTEVEEKNSENNETK